MGAGHPPPLLRGPDGRTAPVTLAGAGLPLGLGTGTYEPTVLSVPDPVLLVLYSDGLVESRDADIDQEITRLARTVDAAAAVEPVHGTRTTRCRPCAVGCCTPLPARPARTTAPCCWPN